MALLISTAERIVEELRREKSTCDKVYTVADAFRKLDPKEQEAFIRGVFYATMPNRINSGRMAWSKDDAEDPQTFEQLLEERASILAQEAKDNEARDKRHVYAMCKRDLLGMKRLSKDAIREMIAKVDPTLDTSSHTKFELMQTALGIRFGHGPEVIDATMAVYF